NLQHACQRQAHPEPQHQQQLMSVTLMLTSLTSPADCTLEEFLRSDCGLILKRGTEASTIGQAKNSDEVDENTPLAVKGFTPGVGHLDSRRVRIDDCLVGVNGIPVRLGDALNPADQYVRRPAEERQSQASEAPCLVTLSFNRRQQQSAQDLPASKMPPPPPVYDLESNCAILVGSGGGGGGGVGGGQSGAAMSHRRHHRLLHGRRFLWALTGTFADVLFAFSAPRRQSRLCGLRGFLMAAWSVWPDLLPRARAKSSRTARPPRRPSRLVLANSRVQNANFRRSGRPGGDSGNAAVPTVQCARLVCVLAAPRRLSLVTVPEPIPVQLAGHLLDLFFLLGWPRGNPVQKAVRRRLNEDIPTGYNEPLCPAIAGKLIVLFTAISERRLPPSLRRLAWPARRQTSGQARDADRLLADFVSGSSPGCPDFKPDTPAYWGGSLADSGSRVASVGCLSHGRQHRRLGHACWLFELLHRHFTVYPAGRRASASCLATGASDARLPGRGGGESPAQPACSQQASANGASAAIRDCPADPADYLTVVNAKSGSGGGILFVPAPLGAEPSVTFVTSLNECAGVTNDGGGTLATCQALGQQQQRLLSGSTRRAEAGVFAYLLLGLGRLGALHGHEALCLRADWRDPCWHLRLAVVGASCGGSGGGKQRRSQCRVTLQRVHPNCQPENCQPTTASRENCQSTIASRQLLAEKNCQPENCQPKLPVDNCQSTIASREKLASRKNCLPTTCQPRKTSSRKRSQKLPAEQFASRENCQPETASRKLASRQLPAAEKLASRKLPANNCQPADNCQPRKLPAGKLPADNCSREICQPTTAQPTSSS
uniref:PDZ domain-containing protein n=1 Tax=Macrostomum lignano TaxID=282301 RepID=A0A1I8FQC5_9PLAT